LRLAALALALAALAGRAAAAPSPVVTFDDPARDATGPGSYQPPGDSQFQEGDFDLRRFAVLVDGDDVVFEVTLGAIVRLPELPQRTNLTPVQFLNGVYLQNVDIYLDTSRTEAGATACIPGRRVAFAGQRSWESAVVLTPQPGPARAIIQDALGTQAGRVIVAEGVIARGRTLVARVPAAALGGPPQPSWGYSVQVSGARWERSYGVVDRLRDVHEPDAFTMPVTTVREAFAFGGGPAGGRANPRVVDVLLPPGVDQQKVLGSYDAASGRLARVPFVYADGSDPFTLEGAPAGSAAAAAQAAQAAQAAATPEPSNARLPEALTPRSLPVLRAPAVPWTIADVSGELVTIAGPTAGLGPLRIGRVLGPDGTPVAKIVVGRVLEGGITASVVEGREKIVRGAVVRFDVP